MEYHSKQGTVFMVQIDHLSGEQIGYAVGRFYDAGASNVQVVSSLTKKNRPSYVIFIDCRQEHRDAVEALIPDELGAGGWHVITTEHHFLYNRIVNREIIVRRGQGCKDAAGGRVSVSDVSGSTSGADLSAGGRDTAREIRCAVKGKLFENGNLRPEHESVIELQEKVQSSFGTFMRYADVYNIIMRCIKDESGEALTVDI